MSKGIAELNTIKWLDIIDTDRLLLPLQWQKVWRGTKEPLDEDEGGEWKSWLKTKLKKKKRTKIMTSGPITAWHIEGEKVEVGTDFFFLVSRITMDSDCSH